MALRGLALLRAIGTDRMPHAAGRSLYDHLRGTAAIVTAWRQPEAVRLAALFHSAYGTSVYPVASARDRGVVREAIGDAAERLAFAFGELDRAAFAAAIAETTEPEPLIAALAILGIANEIEQTCARDGSPASWRARCPSLTVALARWTTVALPDGVRAALHIAPHAERGAIAAYDRALGALGRDDDAAAIPDFESVCAGMPHVAEPWVWRALLALRSGDFAAARMHAATAHARFAAWGSAWDKRITFDDWHATLERISAGNESSALTDVLRLHGSGRG